MGDAYGYIKKIYFSMNTHLNEKQRWEEYCAHELTKILPTLNELGYTIDEIQPHLTGERYLMQAVTTEAGKKIILLGHNKEHNERVVIKFTSNPGGMREIAHERRCRTSLHGINFAYNTFFTPREIHYISNNKFILSIQEFIENECQFIDRPQQEQFELILRAFKAQEGVHATTYEHKKFIVKTFGERTVNDYLASFQRFKDLILKNGDKNQKLETLLEKSEKFLTAHTEIIEQYSGFLTHTDFVPHNFRIIKSNIYLLDHSSICFGNKYEGWARLINFMALYNPQLEKSLVEYVKINRTAEELVSLKLMRIYRLTELIFYYTNTLPKCHGNLLLLNQSRIDFWGNVLEAVIENRFVSEQIIQEYTTFRDTMRDEDEQLRQQGLH